MKTKIILLVCFGLLCLSSGMNGQSSKCYDYDCMMKKAREYFLNGQYEDAVNSATAAKRYSNADEIAADTLIKAVFKEMDNLRVKAIKASEVAEHATAAARQAAEVAESARAEAEKAKNQANRQRDEVLAARQMVEKLIKKGQSLENTFSETNAFMYLYEAGLRYFQWDSINQTRDYPNALTYFALARFLNPKDRLDRLIYAAKTGILAEADFLHGDLDSAEIRYKLMITKLDSTSQHPDFEKWRLHQIEEVRKLYQTFSSKANAQTATPILEGNWWTLPEAFKQYKGIIGLTLKNVPATFRVFPTVLDSLPNLRTLTIVNCKEIRNLKNWDVVSRLTSLNLHDNPNLYALEHLTQLRRLTRLNIGNCPALTNIIGCKKLEYLSIKKSPQARVSALINNNPKLIKLDLADLPADTLNTSKLDDLESLTLTNMNVSNLNGLSQNKALKILKIDQLDQLGSFTPPGNLTEIYISKCNKLTGFDQWPQSDSLKKLVLFENSHLRDLKDWKRFPQMNRLLIQNNNGIHEIKGLQSMKKADEILVINNPNLVTNSINAGVGGDWSLNFTSAKLEFEHRQTIGWGWLKNPEIGFKAMALYNTRKFSDTDLYGTKEKKGFIGGLAINYYLNYIYAGVGVGFGHTQTRLANQVTKESTNFVWYNDLGIQIAPRFLKRDKVGIGVDLYNIFGKNDYYILPSFGVSYYHILGFSRKTWFIRPGDPRRYILLKKRDKEQIDDRLPEKF